MNDRMRRGCCRLLALLLTLVLVIPAYGQETLDALAAAQGCTAETLLQSDKLTAGRLRQRLGGHRREPDRYGGGYLRLPQGTGALCDPDVPGAGGLGPLASHGVGSAPH